jgi:hypothetical protein
MKTENLIRRGGQEPMSYGERFVMTFVMVTIVKNLPMITVLLASKKTSTSTLIKDCNLQKTAGDPLVVAPPVNDTTMKSEAATLQTIYNESESPLPTASKLQVTTQRNICIAAYNQNAGYIQGIARAAAVAAGDVTAGIQVVIRCGYKVKKASVPAPRHFKVTPKGVGGVDIVTKAVGKRASYIREYGITPTKGVPPTTIAEILVSLEADIFVNNLKSGSIYGFREASVLPTKRTTPNVVNPSLAKKTATPTVATTSHKVTFTDGAEHYTWSDWVYVIVL